MSTPLMILSDAPSSLSGLGRICRELGQRIVANLSDTFRLCTLGYGGVGSLDLPWQQYTMCGDPPSRNWFVPELYMAWNDFAGNEPGIVMTIWDASRMAWLVEPSACPDAVIREWLGKRPFQLWGYWPVDAEGIAHHLPHGYADVMRHYDRNLAYSEWSRGLMNRDGIAGQALPHGIDTGIWYPRNRQQARQKVRNCGMKRLGDNSLLVGVVATNQARKDWALACETCSLLLKQGRDVLMWFHVDALRRYWDIVALVQDFGLLDRVLVTQPPMQDEDMAELYSACDVTLGIGLGEGWGFPLVESIACGTPVVHGNYGGGAEFLQKECLVEPVTYRTEGQFSCLRPVFDAEDWATKAIQVSGTTPIVPDYIRWENAWNEWGKWFRAGVE